MMWDFGGNSNEHERRGRRSPQPTYMRMPSPAYQIPHSEANATMGSYFSGSYPPVAASASYNSYIYPSISRSPSPFPPSQTIHIIHHSKHHSSSKNKHHNHNHRDLGHGHSHSHTRSRSHSRPAGQPSPSPSPMTPFPISPTTPFPTPNDYPHFRFPTVPYLPHMQSSTSKIPKTSPTSYAPSHGYIQSSHPQPKPQRPKLTSLPMRHLNSDFQYSNCTGRRRALCIGINYRGQEKELRGCINDAKKVCEFLMLYQYHPKDIMLLTDETNDPQSLPTRHNILKAMHWLVRGAKPNDSLFLHYSGHGGQTRDLDGDEADGWDEVIYPLDFERNGHIVDDQMHDIMVRPLPRGCRLTGLFDACHSGSVLDLPYVYSSRGHLENSSTSYRAQARKATPADVISWSACKDGQVSADTFADGVAVGVMSHAFITALTTKPHQTYKELLRSIRLLLKERYNQKPQLGSSYHIDTNLRFIF